jgi:hypothetical protein
MNSSGEVDVVSLPEKWSRDMIAGGKLAVVAPRSLGVIDHDAGENSVRKKIQLNEFISYDEDE